MARYVCIIFILYIVYASVNQAWSCTAFSFSKDGETFVARNYDWRVADGLVVKNPRGLKKVAYVSGNGQQSQQAHWISRFGSVSFNQYGREFPAGGMNETGLVVEGLLVKEASYPAYDQRGVVQQGQWVQYLLDCYGSVSEVLAAIDTYRISPEITPFSRHVFLVDAKGGSAVIEYINGKAVVYTADTLPVTVLTNCAYSVALDGLAGNRSNSVDPYESIPRFVRCARQLERHKLESARNPIKFAFDLLQRSKWEVPTQWRIVYQPAIQQIHLQSSGSHQIRYLKLTELDFSCTYPAEVQEIHCDFSGNVHGRFQPYDRELNGQLIKTVVAKTPFLKDITPDMLIPRIVYPEQADCQGQ